MNGARTRIHVGAQAQQAQTNPNGNGSRQIPSMMGAGPMLPPLEPQPMPNQTSDESGRTNVADADNSSNDDDGTSSRKDMKKFECAICFGK